MRKVKGGCRVARAFAGGGLRGLRRWGRLFLSRHGLSSTFLAVFFFFEKEEREEKVKEKEKKTLPPLLVPFTYSLQAVAFFLPSFFPSFLLPSSFHLFPSHNVQPRRLL